MQSDVSQEKQALEMSPFQQRTLAIPEKYDLFLGGGRGRLQSEPIRPCS